MRVLCGTVLLAALALGAAGADGEWTVNRLPGTGTLWSASRTRAEIAAATQGVVRVETDAKALAALETNRVTRWYDPEDTNRYAVLEGGTNIVIYRSMVTGTNFVVTLSDDFEETVTHTRPAWTNHVWPFNEGGWYGNFGGEELPADLMGTSDLNSSWSGTTSWESQIFPKMLAPTTAAQGTATVSIASYIYGTNVEWRYILPTNAIPPELANLDNLQGWLNNIFVPLSAFNARVAAVESDVAAIALTTNGVVLDPYSKTLYADLATTNTAGYAGFLTTNTVERSLTSVAPTNGQSLARFRYDFTCKNCGTMTFSAYAQSTVMGVTNNRIFARLSAYSQAGVLLASATGSTVEIDPAAYSNVTAEVPLPYQVTNGYAVAELFSATNTTKNVRVMSGGSHPATLSLSIKPLNYATIAETDYLYITKTGGVDLTSAAYVRVPEPSAGSDAATADFVRSLVTDTLGDRGATNLVVGGSSVPYDAPTRTFNGAGIIAPAAGVVTNGQADATIGGVRLNANTTSSQYGSFDYSINFAGAMSVRRTAGTGNDMIFSGYTDSYGENFDRMILKSNGDVLIGRGALGIFDSGSNFYWRVTASNGLFYASDTNGVRQFKFVTEAP